MRRALMGLGFSMAFLGLLALANAANNFPIDTFGGTRTVVKSVDDGTAHTIVVQMGNPFPSGSTALTGSGTGTTGSVAATLAGAASVTTYLCGFVVTFSNPTAATNVTVAITGTITGTMSYQRQVLAAAATVPPPADLNVVHSPCVPASAVNTSIVVTQPGLGAGATGTSVAAWGYRL